MKTKLKCLYLVIPLLLSSNSFAGNYLYRVDLGNVNLFPDSKYSYTEWLDLGEAKDCGGWSPLASTVDFGLAYQQERTCKQDQVRDATIIYRNDTTGAEKEGSTVQQHQTVNAVSSQDAVGTNAQLAVSSSGTLEFQNDAALTVTAKTYSGSTVEWSSSSNLSLTGNGDTAIISASTESDGWVKYRLINGELTSPWSNSKAIDVVNDYVDTRYLAGTSYNGNNNYITSAQYLSNFSFETWVKPNKAIKPGSNTSNLFVAQTSDGTMAPENYVFGAIHGYESGWHGVGLSVGTNGIKVFCHSSGYMPNLVVYYDSIPSNQWTHVGVVVLDNVPYLYVNGNLVRIGVRPSSGVLASPRAIGDVTGYGPFYGQVAETRVWNGALSAPEMKQVYNRHLDSGFSPASSRPSVIAKVK